MCTAKVEVTMPAAHFVALEALAELVSGLSKDHVGVGDLVARMRNRRELETDHWTMHKSFATSFTVYMPTDEEEEIDEESAQARILECGKRAVAVLKLLDVTGLYDELRTAGVEYAATSAAIGRPVDVSGISQHELELYHEELGQQVAMVEAERRVDALREELGIDAHLVLTDADRRELRACKDELERLGIQEQALLREKARRASTPPTGEPGPCPASPPSPSSAAVTIRALQRCREVIDEQITEVLGGLCERVEQELDAQIERCGPSELEACQ